MLRECVMSRPKPGDGVSGDAVTVGAGVEGGEVFGGQVEGGRGMARPGDGNVGTGSIEQVSRVKGRGVEGGRGKAGGGRGSGRYELEGAARGGGSHMRALQAYHGVEVRDAGITAARVRQVKGGPVPWNREVHGYRPGGVGEEVDGPTMHVEAAGGVDGQVDGSVTHVEQQVDPHGGAAAVEKMPGGVGEEVDGPAMHVEAAGGVDEQVDGSVMHVEQQVDPHGGAAAAEKMQWACPSPSCGYVHGRRETVEQHFAVHDDNRLQAVQVPVSQVHSSQEEADHRGLRTLIAMWSLNKGDNDEDKASNFSARSWMLAAAGGLRLRPLPSQQGPAREEVWAEQLARLLGECGMSEYVVDGRLTQLRKGGSLDEYDNFIRRLLPAVEKQAQGALAILRQWGGADPPEWPPTIPPTAESFVKVYIEGFDPRDSIDTVQMALLELFPAMYRRKWPTDIRMPSKSAKDSVEAWRIRLAPRPVVCLTVHEAMEWMTGARQGLQRDDAGNLRLKVFVGGETRWLVMGWVQSDSDLRLKARVMVKGKTAAWAHNQGLSLWNHMLGLVGAMGPAREELASALLAAQGLPNNGVAIGGHVKAGLGGRTALRSDMADEMLVAVSEEVADACAGKTFTLIVGDFRQEHLLLEIMLVRNESTAAKPRGGPSEPRATLPPLEEYHAIAITFPPGPLHRCVGDGESRNITAADVLEFVESWLRSSETFEQTEAGEYATLAQTLIDESKPTFGVIAKLSALGMMLENRVYVVCKSKEAAAVGLHVLRESQKPSSMQSKHFLSTHPWDRFMQYRAAAEAADTVQYQAGVVAVREFSTSPMPDITTFTPWTKQQEHILTRPDLIEHGVLQGKDQASVRVEDWAVVGESVPANFSTVGQEVQCVCCAQMALGQQMTGTAAGPSLCYPCIGLISAVGQAGISRLTQSSLTLEDGMCPECGKANLVMQTGKADERMWPTPSLCGSCHLRIARNHCEIQCSSRPDPIHHELVTAAIAALQQAFAARAHSPPAPPESNSRVQGGSGGGGGGGRVRERHRSRSRDRSDGGGRRGGGGGHREASRSRSRSPAERSRSRSLAVALAEHHEQGGGGGRDDPTGREGGRKRHGSVAGERYEGW